jgi:hypothetical protein
LSTTPRTRTPEHDVALHEPRGRAVDFTTRNAILERGGARLVHKSPFGHVGVGVDDLDLVERSDMRTLCSCYAFVVTCCGGIPD